MRCHEAAAATSGLGAPAWHEFRRPLPDRNARAVGESAEPVVSMRAMTATARFYFWYYAFPKPQAEEGSRSV
jgi:hypothetical protein